MCSVLEPVTLFLLKATVELKDLYGSMCGANAFFATPTIPQTIPKGYVNIEMEPHARLF